jgi:CBS domain containing-hemolysin-like protein
MRITKDEARIVSAALESHECDAEELMHRTSIGPRHAMEALESLEKKLEAFEKAERRRSSKYTLSDVLKRFIDGR